MNTSVSDRVSFWSLFLVITLLPVFFLPFTSIPIETAKGLLLILGLAVSIVSWAIGRLSDGKIVIPKSSLLLAGFGVVVAFFLSSFFSSTLNVSLFGTMFDVGTFYFILAAFLLMVYSAIIFRDAKKVSLFLVGIVLSSVALLIFQSIYLFFPKFLGFGILIEKTDNLLGVWRAFGFYAGFSSLVALFMLEFFSVSKIMKLMLAVLIFLGLAMVVLIASSNFPLIWALIGIFALIIFVYKASMSSKEPLTESRKMSFPVISFIVATIAILFFMSGQFFGGYLPNRLGIVSNEVSPSFRATMLLTKSVLQTNPIFGIGPNRFGEAWALYKSPQINATQFWDVPFDSGSGLLPTLTATTGSVGILTLIIFFAFFLTVGVQSIFSSMRRGVNYKLTAFFVIALYLFIASFFYTTGFVLILLAFAFTGVFIGFSSANHEGGEISISFLNDHRKSFFFMVFLIFIMITSIVASFKYGERFASVVYFRKALLAQTIPVAESTIGKAVSLYSNDLYLRTYSQIYLLKLNSLAAKNSASLSEADKTDIKTSIDQAVSSAQLATTYNSKNYLNFQTLGSVYQSIASLGMKDANTRAVEAYKTANMLNPLNPKIKLAMASASFADGKKDDAKTFANEALTLKPDYVDALLTLAQIAKSEGNNTSALSYAERALSLVPDDKNLIQYVDSFKKGDEAPVKKTP